MRQFALAAILALVLGSQADAQMFRRAGVYYYPSAGVSYSTPSYYYTPSYYNSGAVVTAGYYATPTWTYDDYTYPTYSSYYYPSYSGYTYTNSYVYPRYGRRWYR